ncbi:hypothetical protein BU15DRAFT_64668 [Melanogaster broomeanus]|nr:hypothetical protein BU15DRAFT_64668 [Melanogaster broomeanus]
MEAAGLPACCLVAIGYGAEQFLPRSVDEPEFPNELILSSSRHEKDVYIETLEWDRRFLAEREQAEREEKEKEQDAGAEEKRKAEADLGMSPFELEVVVMQCSKGAPHLPSSRPRRVVQASGHERRPPRRVFVAGPGSWRRVPLRSSGVLRARARRSHAQLLASHDAQNAELREFARFCDGGVICESS